MEHLKLLFQGDSLTDAGRNKEVKECNTGLGSGYVEKIAGRILFKNSEAEIYNRGNFGDRIADMYARWAEDALNIPFNVISIMNGVNDVGFSLRLNCGANAKKFRFVYDRILYETKEAKPNADIILCQPFLIKRIYERENDIFENWNTWHSEITERGQIVKELAQKYDATYVDFETAIDSALKKAPAEHWSVDCIHLTCAGNEMLARKWLECAKPILDKYNILTNPNI